MSIWLWVGFIIVVLGLLAVDLGVFNREAHVIGIRESLLWTAFWIALSLLFNVFVYFAYANHWFGIGTETAAIPAIHGEAHGEPDVPDQPGGVDPITTDAHGPTPEGRLLNGKDAALKFLTGYLVEKALSLDNIFVIALIFSYFGVPGKYQHRTLFWGIVGALVFRGIMIAAGATLLHRFEWTIYIFGGLLLFTAWRMWKTDHDSVHPNDNPLVKLARRLYPVTEDFHGQKFFVRLADGTRAMTPLFLVLLVIESTDVIFAVDSIPAIFAITDDPFIVFTSNICAILGLRALYFALAGLINRFVYLKPALTLMLAYIGVKMIISPYLKIPVMVSLIVIVGTLTVGIVASLAVTADDAEGELTEETAPGEPRETPTLANGDDAAPTDDETADPVELETTPDNPSPSTPEPSGGDKSH